MVQGNKSAGDGLASGSVRKTGLPLSRARVACADYPLRRTINQIDGVSQEAFKRIEVICKALGQMLADNEAAVGVLELIDYIAADAANQINCLAEEHDAHYRDGEPRWPSATPELAAQEARHG